MAINNVILCGRLVDNPTFRKIGEKSNVNFKLAVDRDKKVDGQPTADFINCVAWMSTADVINKYTIKGSQVNVIGRLQTRNYDGSDGRKVYVTEIVVNSVQLLGKKVVNEVQERETTTNSEDGGIIISSDDLPF